MAKDKDKKKDKPAKKQLKAEKKQKKEKKKQEPKQSKKKSKKKNGKKAEKKAKAKRAKKGSGGQTVLAEERKAEQARLLDKKIKKEVKKQVRKELESQAAVSVAAHAADPSVADAEEILSQADADFQAIEEEMASQGAQPQSEAPAVVPGQMGLPSVAQPGEPAR